MTPFEILNIKSTANPEEIKIAYRKLCLKLHPDINKASNASEKFRELNNAYEFLINNKPIPKINNDNQWKPRESYAPPKPPKPEPQKPKRNYEAFKDDYYYRVLEKGFEGYSIDIPEKVLMRDTVVHCMKSEVHSSEEFRIILKKGTVLPAILNITNLKHPLRLKINPNWGF